LEEFNLGNCNTSYGFTFLIIWTLKGPNVTSFQENAARSEVGTYRVKSATNDACFRGLLLVNGILNKSEMSPEPFQFNPLTGGT